MRICKSCSRDESIIVFPKTGKLCRECKAKTLRDRKLTDPEYYKKRAAYRAKNSDKINAQKRASYDRNSNSVKAKNNVYYHVNQDKCKARQRTYQARVETVDVRSWLSKCLKHTRFADRRLNREFDLDIEFLLDLYEKQRGLCAITGVLMTHARNDLFAISVDRINDGGHVRGNIQLVCQAANLAKREYGNEAIHRFLLAAFKVHQTTVVPDFTGFVYPESTQYYSLAHKEQVITKLQCVCSDVFVPPSYSDDDIVADAQRVIDENASNYVSSGVDGVIWRSHYPDNRGFAGKKIVRQYQPHLWNIRVSKKPLISEVWGRGALFEKAAWNLVNGGTKISLDRIIRELTFAGAGVASQMHPGFAKAVYCMFCKVGDLVFDPFAGWGGRLLGAWSAGMYYVANELSRPTYDGLCNIAAKVDYKCELYNNNSFECDIPAAHVMFTSPPFGTEQYIDSNTHCDLSKLLDITSHIPLRILHVNRALLPLLQNRARILPVVARTKAAGGVSNEYLAII